MQNIRPVEWRIGTVDDIPAVVEIGREMHPGTRYAGLSWAGERLARTIAWVATEPSGLFLVALSGKRVVGALAAVAVEHCYLQSECASVLAVLLRPEHQGGLIETRLIKGYIAWAREMEIPDELVTASAIQGSGSSVYTACGFKQTGNVYALKEN